MSVDRNPTLSSDHRSSWLHAGNDGARAAAPIPSSDRWMTTLRKGHLDRRMHANRHPEPASAGLCHAFVPTPISSALLKSP